MSYKKNLCVYKSFNIKRHIYTSVISWCVQHSQEFHTGTQIQYMCD